MARTSEMKADTASVKPEPLVISRHFAAPRDLVFKAWSSAEHIKRWFSPEGYTVPEAEIDFRAGGVFGVCMRTPTGEDHWIEGRVRQGLCRRIGWTFTAGVTFGGAKRFTVQTTVTFEDDGMGTRMTVRQAYDIHDPAFLSVVGGSAEGWRTTLNKLEREVARIADTEPRSVVHAIFSLERVYDASPALVFRALSDPAAKARWFEGGGGWTPIERTMDVRPGGRERAKGRWPNGLVTTFDAVYFDVVPNRRLVYCYEMHLDARKISVSLATIEPAELAAGAGTRLRITEQGAFLDGYDDAGSREHGTGFLLERLGASLGA